MWLPCDAAKADPVPASMILGAMAGRGGGGAAAAIARKIMLASGVDVTPKRFGIPAHQPLAVLIAASSCGVPRNSKADGSGKFGEARKPINALMPKCDLKSSLTRVCSKTLGPKIVRQSHTCAHKRRPHAASLDATRRAPEI